MRVFCPKYISNSMLCISLCTAQLFIGGFDIWCENQLCACLCNDLLFTKFDNCVVVAKLYTSTVWGEGLMKKNFGQLKVVYPIIFVPNIFPNSRLIHILQLFRKKQNDHKTRGNFKAYSRCLVFFMDTVWIVGPLGRAISL